MIDYVLGDETDYEVRDYKDYVGPGFKVYKSSPYFKRPGIRSKPGYLKSEVAAFSEMTKIMLLVGMVFIVGFCIWLDIKAIQLFGDKEFRTLRVLLITVPVGLVFNVVSISMYPRAVFLIKNFKAPTKNE